MTTLRNSETTHFNLIIRNSGQQGFEEQVALLRSAGASSDDSTLSALSENFRKRRHTRAWWLSLERALAGDPPESTCFSNPHASTRPGCGWSIDRRKRVNKPPHHPADS